MSNDFYVYLHLRASDGSPFYAGKGRNNRVFSKESRNRFWRSTYAKHGVKHEILRSGLSEQEAFALERDTIRRLRESGSMLCNLTDGGEGVSGFKPDADARIRMAESARARALRFVRDKNVYHLAHMDGREFSGNRLEIRLSLGINYASLVRLIKGLNKTAGGWYDASVNSADAASRPSGERHHFHDASVYTILNDSGESMSGTHYELSLAAGIAMKSMSGVIRSKKKSGGWRLITTIQTDRSLAKLGSKNPMHGRVGADNARSDKAKYVFEKDGEKVTATRYEMRERFDLNTKNIGQIINGEKKTHRGWRFIGPSLGHDDQA